MSRIMYDAVSWENIPDNAEMVAGYIDGPASQWSAEAWARFPHAVKVRITVNPADNEGDVLDVRSGATRIPRTRPAGSGAGMPLAPRSSRSSGTEVHAAGRAGGQPGAPSTACGTSTPPWTVPSRYRARGSHPGVAGGPHAPYDMSVVHDDCVASTELGRVPGPRVAVISAATAAGPS